MTGVRRGELFALKWTALDESKGTLTIQEAIYDNVIGTPKTEKSVRVIPLPATAVQLLCDWRGVAARKGAEDFI
jgi:integrase